MMRLSAQSLRVPCCKYGLRLFYERDGNAAIEFALTLPALMLLLLGIMELGRALWTQSALSYSVDQAARCASIDTNTCGSVSQIQNYAAGAGGASFSSSVFTVSTTGCGSLVSATYPVQLNIPFAAYAITLTAQSCYPK